jgi:lipid-binding SYLF domain-containing protein
MTFRTLVYSSVLTVGLLGVVGRDAEASTETPPRAEILSYSRACGLFAGLTIRDSAVREDRDSNEDFCGRRLRTRETVLDGQAPAPQSAEALTSWFEALKAFVPNTTE